MKPLEVIRLASPIIRPDPSRVVARPFIPASEDRVRRIAARALALGEEEARRLLEGVLAEFGPYNPGLRSAFGKHYAIVERHLAEERPSEERKLLIGAYFTSEYSFESAAVFNPSIVPHPDQGGLPEGALRYVMSVRSVGEGHVSSISFRTGTVYADGSVSVNPLSKAVARAETVKSALYEKKLFLMKLGEMGFGNDFLRDAAERLAEGFTFDELASAVSAVLQERDSQVDSLTADKMMWLARSNYEIEFDEGTEFSERLIFPASPTEQNGIEDARFVRFEDAGRVRYYATYTAYDGKLILPQIIETDDFRRICMITLNGRVVENKGMALFPRKLGGRYAMLSRQDNESVFLMYSDNLHFWREATRIAEPMSDWEFIQIGNCGSPIELDEGWLVLTHGVGPMRKYSIGAMLLDKEDPSKVVGRLAEPLISPSEGERAGYVPNVVYTCGSLVHAGRLLIPYGTSDMAIAFASLSVKDLVRRMTGDSPAPDPP